MVQGEEAGEDFFLGEVGGPAVGGEDGFVEGLVGVGEPGGSQIIEVGEGAFGKFVRIDVGRIEPGVAEADEFAGGVGDGFDARVGFFAWLGPGRPGEWEGIEAGRAIVGGSGSLVAVTMPGAGSYTPGFMDS